MSGLFSRKNVSKENESMIVKPNEVDSETGKNLIGAINEIEDVMMKATGSANVIIAGGHEAIDKVLEQSKAILEEITHEFAKKHPDAINLYWITYITQTHLIYIDMAGLMEAQHSSGHRESCKLFLALFPYAHLWFDDLDNPNGWGKQFSRSNNRKVRDMASKVVSYLEEYNKILYMTENSIKNAIKFETENKNTESKTEQ